MTTATKASPALLERIDRLAGCQGHWVLIRDGQPERDCSHQWHETPEGHLATCLADRWRNVSLGFCPSYVGYSDYSDLGLVGLSNYPFKTDADSGLVGLSNYRVMTDAASTPDPHGAVLKIGYGWNGAGVVLDLRYITDDQLEKVEALENYPLICEDDHYQVEWDGIDADWCQESIADRVRMLQDLGLCIFAARDASAPYREGFERLRESILENLNDYPTALA